MRIAARACALGQREGGAAVEKESAAAAVVASDKAKLAVAGAVEAAKLEANARVTAAEVRQLVLQDYTGVEG